MGMTAENNYYWEGERVRLRPMHANDVELWLAEERSDSEAVRFLNCGMDLPKSVQAAQSFAERYGDIPGSVLYPALREGTVLYG